MSAAGCPSVIFTRGNGPRPGPAAAGGRTPALLFQERIIADRQHRAENHFDAVMLRQFRHRHDVLFDQFGRHRTRVARNVVGAGQHDHYSRLQVDHIRIHANQHLRRSLPADPAIHIRLAGKGLIQPPEVCNRIAHEHDPLRIGRLFLQFFVGLMIAAELVPVLKLVCQTLRAVEETAVGSRWVELIRQLGVSMQSAKQQCGEQSRNLVHMFRPIDSRRWPRR